MITPFFLPISDATDNTGNATIDEQLVQGKYSLINAAVQANGNPIITFGKINQPLLPSGGKNAALGPLLFMPGDTMEVIINSATPGSNITGVLFGYQADRLQELPVIQPNTNGALPTYGNQQVIGNLSGTVGSTVNSPSPFPVPTGTQSIGYMVRYPSSPLFKFPQTIQIVGHQSNQPYLNTNLVIGTGGPQWVPFSSASDQSVDVNMLCSATGSSDIDILASPLLPVVEATTTAVPLDIQITNQVGTPFGATSFPPSVNPSLNVYQPNSSPFQSAIFPPQPFSINLAATGITHLIPKATVTGVGPNARIYLWALNYSISAAGSFAGNFQDTAATPNVFHFDTFQNGSPRAFSFFASILTIGQGLDWNTTAAGATFMIGSVVYSIA